MLSLLSASQWNERTAAHLLNRAGFGGTPADIEAVHRRGLSDAVRGLVDIPPEATTPTPPSWAKPRNIRELRTSARAEDDPARRQEKMRELRITNGTLLGPANDGRNGHYARGPVGFTALPSTDTADGTNGYLLRKQVATFMIRGFFF